MLYNWLWKVRLDVIAKCNIINVKRERLAFIYYIIIFIIFIYIDYIIIFIYLYLYLLYYYFYIYLLYYYLYIYYLNKIYLNRVNSLILFSTSLLSNERKYCVKLLDLFFKMCFPYRRSFERDRLFYSYSYYPVDSPLRRACVSEGEMWSGRNVDMCKSTLIVTLLHAYT